MNYMWLFPTEWSSLGFSSCFFFYYLRIIPAKASLFHIWRLQSQLRITNQKKLRGVSEAHTLSCICHALHVCCVLGTVQVISLILMTTSWSRHFPSPLFTTYPHFTYRGNWGTEKSSHVPSITQLVNSRTGKRSQVCLTSKPSPLITMPMCLLLQGPKEGSSHLTMATVAATKLMHLS